MYGYVTVIASILRSPELCDIFFLKNHNIGWMTVYAKLFSMLLQTVIREVATISLTFAFMLHCLFSFMATSKYLLIFFTFLFYYPIAY